VITLTITDDYTTDAVPITLDVSMLTTTDDYTTDVVPFIKD
jgi:hypothetical protein